MSSVNKVILVGRLGRDPEVRYSPSGVAFANFSMATQRKWKDKNGEKQEETEWHSVVFSEKLAEVVGEYLKKGSLVYVDGYLKTRKWQDKTGSDRYSTEIKGQSLQMLGGKSDDDKPASRDRPQQRNQQQQEQQSKPQAQSDFSDMDDDIPF